MAPSSYFIHNRPYGYLSSIAEEMTRSNDKNTLFELNELSVLAAFGERSGEFLQGQISCDVQKVTKETMQQGAFCNLQGRILALCALIDWQGLKLILPKDLVKPTEALLNKPAMLSRVHFEEQNEYAIYGFYLNNKNDLLPEQVTLPSRKYGVNSNENACCYALCENLFILIVPTRLSESLKAPFLAKQQLRGSLAWHKRMVMHKQIEIYPETRGLFLPHRLDLQLSNHLSFDKGCYKGQEIIARMHYRSKTKHSLQCFIIETKAPPLPGKKVFDVTGKSEIGEMIDCCPLDDKRFVVAVSILQEHPDEVLIESQEIPVTLLQPDNNFK
ncbi:MAG: folate-binding protein YgfZ [Tatlockia sp.]|jgi:hypothetical protein